MLAGGYRMSDVTNAYMEQNDSPPESDGRHSRVRTDLDPIFGSS